MAIKVGSFTKPTGSSPPPTVISGLGFVPKVVLFWSSGSLVSGTVRSGVNGFVGAEDLLANDASAGRGVAFAARDAVGTTADYSFATTRPVVFTSDAGVTLAQATATLSMDGFSLTWLSNNASAYLVHWLAIGGGITQAKVISWYMPSTTGQKFVGGVGFRPAAVIHIYGGGTTPTTHDSIGIGASDGSGNQWAVNASGQSQSATSNGLRSHVSDASIQIVKSDQSTLARATHVSLDSDGFTLDFTTASGTTVIQNNLIISVCIAGVIASAGTVAKPTSAAPAAQSIATPGFRPDAVMFAGASLATLSSGTTQGRLALGASDGTTQGTSAHIDNNGAGTTVVKAVSLTNKAFAKLDTSSAATDAEASLTGMSASGFDLSWTKNDAVATQLSYLALGPLTQPIKGSSAGTSKGVAILRLSHALTARSFGTSDKVAWFNGHNLVSGASLGTSAAVPPNLAIGRNLTAKSTGTSASSSRLSFSHPLSATSVGTSAKSAIIGIRHALTASSIGTGLTTAALRLNHPLLAISKAASGSQAYFVVVLPKPRTSAANESAGTVNLIRNPSAEVNTTDWSGENGATITRVTDHAWDGIASIRAALPGTAANEGVSVRTLQGLAYAGVEAVTWGQIRLAGTATGIAVWVRGRYSDGTTSDGEKLTGLTLAHSGLTSADWLAVYAPAFFSDPVKTLVSADIVVTREVASGAATLYADGAQIEEDRGQGPTAFTIGSYGGDLGAWTGATHLSPSIRQPLAMTIAASGHDGTVLVERWLYRSTYDNQWLEDLSAYVLSGEVSMSPERDVTWSLSATMTLEGWKKLTEFEDWLAPYMKVTYPDGTVKEGQLGLYVVLPSPQEREEGGGTVQVDARDALWLLAIQGFTGPLFVRAGTDKVRSARAILDSAALTSGPDDHRRYAGPDGQNNTKRNREFPTKTSKLEAANQMLTGAGMYPLWTTNVGQWAWDKRGKRRLRNSRPVRLWAAHLPEGTTVDRRIPAVSTLPSEVTGAISLSPKGGDMANEIILVNDAPHGRTHVKRKVTHPSNPRSLWFVVVNQPGPDNPGAPANTRYRRKVREIHHPLIESDADADEVAQAIAEELSTRNQTVSMTVLPDPSVNYIHETVVLGLYDASGEKIVVGQFAVHSVRWSLGPDDYTQSMELGRVDSSDDILQLPDVAA